ncbi:hypothetical protein [Methylobacter sp.]|uniref:hypothetical protein n=1 Tax=Methylobacter sp. TaxID=2051955 RepID=UPI00121F4B41|nr:hypothetical protein [Methylobacter sp.]TAK61652.1 MAG: hypothetical protein EPO18_13130 [Methylobacter sp.]
MKKIMLLLFLLPTITYGAGSLCDADEQVLFSCPVGKSGKLVSLCGFRKLEKDVGYLQYRYGSPKNIELTFPSAKAGSLEKFRYAHYFRFQVDRTFVSFSNGGFEYSVFTNYDGEEESPVQEKGVTVFKKSQPDKETNFICSSPVSEDLGKLENILPCDKESDFASCGE